MVPEINSYIKDTNDFIRKLMEIDTLPYGAILCTVDVVGLYPHIPHDEGLQAVKEALVAWDSNLDKRKKLGDLKNDIVDLTEIVLKNNNFVLMGNISFRNWARRLELEWHRLMSIFVWTNLKDS